ncbi:9-O-acetylesterase [Arachidicoccus ginsenosidimutans]|uniref:sialate O-acetylesterase n=1 Tax=Arachidicoccus sp. BS20 TaxID=1850526 RepID=UPI0007F0A8FE|nr:sialate O-acetylesterase [Arachidicoccus sp. BS20]ANI89617.1 9-O-acetylesterase [Arachidicoccus sp. BS20]
MKKALLVLLLLFTVFISFAQLKLPALVSDSMILQRDQPVKIWGWNLNGKEVTVSFNNKVYKAKPDSNKKWLVTLAATKAGGPYTMKISTANDTVEIKNILFGDVWLCSGQSNMEFAMSRLIEKEAKDIAASANTNIREFHVNRQYSFTVKNNVTGKWKQANPANILRFSAAAYYMAKNLYEKYKIPIGIIHSSWGGTPAEAWTSVEGLKEFSYYIKRYNYFKDTANFNAAVKKDKEIKDNWYKKVRDNDSGFLSNGTTYANPAYDADKWKTLQVPSFWETQGLANVDGVVWARKDVFLSREQTQHKAVLDVGMIDDEDTTYFNGVKVGSSPNKYVPRRYTVPASLLRTGKNVIVVRIIDRNGYGGFIKDNPYRLTVGGKDISLEGAWKYAIGDSVAPLPSETFTVMPYQPAVLFNGMIAPLIPYTIKGFAWYQGEANSGKAAEYAKLLPALINDWRNRWQQGNLPFLIVQLANYMAVQTQPSEGGWAWIRESQLKVSQTVPNTALAVAVDIGETNTVHPLNKKEVGKRLALAAEKIAYHENTVVYSGPIYKSMKVEGNKIIVSFTNVGSGLIAKDGELKRFAVAGADKKFVWAKAKIENNKVIVWNDTISNPVAVRYAWANNPMGCNLYNKEGLPASPFRTDDWNK